MADHLLLSAAGDVVGKKCALSRISDNLIHRKQMIEHMNGSVKEPNISIYFFFRPSLNGALFPMFCLLVEGECQILVF